MTEKIYRAAMVNGKETYFELTGINTATGNAKGIDLNTGKKITVKYNDIGGRVYLVEQELAERFPNYRK